jgi:hypothetical protein
MDEQRRFPPPWTVEKTEACYIVRDAEGYALGYFYYDDRPITHTGRYTLKSDEARRLAKGFARLPELMGR